MMGHVRVKSPWSQLGIFLGLFGGGFIIGSLVMGTIGLMMGMGEGMTNGKLDWSNPRVLSVMKMIQAVSSILIFFLPAFVFALITSYRKPLAFLGLRPAPVKPMYVLAIVGILVSFPLVFWLGEINQMLPMPHWMDELEREATKQMQQFLRAENTFDVIVNVIIIALLPAICEEVCFRGALQRIIIQITKNAWAGIIVTSILFSALHLQFEGFLPRMFLGIILGAFYWFSGSLWTSIFAHFVNNAIQVVVVSYAPQYVDKNPAVPIYIAILSGLMIVGILWVFRTSSRVTYNMVYGSDDIVRNNEFPA